MVSIITSKFNYKLVIEQILKMLNYISLKFHINIHIWFSSQCIKLLHTFLNKLYTVHTDKRAKKGEKSRKSKVSPEEKVWNIEDLNMNVL